MSAAYEPGIHRGLTNERYHRAPGLSRSRLRILLESTPQRFKHAPPVVETDAMRAGTAGHWAVLEPEVFAERVVAQPTFKGTGSVKAREEWKAANADKIDLPADTYERLVEASRLVRSKKGPATALREGDVEVAAFWERDDVLLKAKPDFLNVDMGLCVDLKFSSRGLGDRRVISTLEDQYAAMQAAMVRMGVHALTGKDIASGMHLLMVDIESTPIDMRLVEIGEAWLTRGETQVMTALRLYTECVESGKWPGYADQGVTSAPPIPSWLASRDEREALANMNP